MRRFYLLLLVFHISVASFGQSQKAYNSSDILLQLKKLNVLGSVLYIGAHPDDENNSLLPYLANERFLRTAYLSLTRGDGGQNLVGQEQGIELGLIRTQELLAARRMDGAEQFFSRAYEFGYSKSSEEALRIWDKEKILSDVVWVIRQFQPDVIIKRFPTDARAGHGHHAASAILADEAFLAAADPTRFPEQFNYGVKPWQATRIMLNTFNFGGNNTTSPDQLKIDIGGYNPLLGASYGEIGADARTMHKSQGEGRPQRRGQLFEYFATSAGDSARNDLMDGVTIDWTRIKNGGGIQKMINTVISDYKTDYPERSVPALVKLFRSIKKLPEENWRNKKLSEVQQLIEACSGLFAEATSSQQRVVQGDLFNVSFFLNKRREVTASVKNIRLENFDSTFSAALATNQNVTFNRPFLVANDKKISQPYWLEHPLVGGNFDVRDQNMIGKAENDPPFEVSFLVNIEGEEFVIKRPVQYRFVDPVKGDLYEPIAVLPKVELRFTRDNYISVNGQPAEVEYLLRNNNSNEPISYKFVEQSPNTWENNYKAVSYNEAANTVQPGSVVFKPISKESNTTEEINLVSANEKYDGYTKSIAYDHIPTITYFPKAKANLVKLDINIKGKKIGYIVGAGDKVPQSLEALGYDVRFLSEPDLTDNNLKQFDAIITGIRAYNIYEYLSNKNAVLMRYVEQGGNLIVQYLRSNQVGTKKVQVGPYPFTVNSQSRVTEENAKVNFLLPHHPALNYPNIITQKDFEGWVQERSTYQAEQTDSHYEALLSMNDTNDKVSNGSLLIAKHGKGNFVYTGLVFFRQLPAGVPGAYRFMANLIGLK